MALTSHLSSNTSLAVVNDALLVFVKVVNHVAAGDFALSDNSRKRTLSTSDRPVFINVILSNRFMKSCGSWSSGFPVNEQLVMSDMFRLSRWFWGMCGSGNGEDCWVLGVVSSGVQVAGENVNWEEGVEISVRLDDSDVSSDSKMGVVLRVVGMKWQSSSLSLVSVGWRGVSLDQGISSVN
jgi:hypothetical protein